MWSKVIKKGRKKASLTAAGSQPAPKVLPSSLAQGARKERNKRKKAPNTSEVTITCPPGEYAEVLKRAKREISLEELGISNPRRRTGQTPSELPSLKNWVS